ncbi:MAG: ribonuclease P protein component [Myxococcales bacterium]|nr:ribonuclease P protein component [Myxococcales bacterium]
MLKKGRRVQSGDFVIYFLPVASGPSALGITVSRKVGNAVRRNRIKRWLREVFRRHRELFEVPVQLVVIARPGGRFDRYEAVVADWQRAFAHYKRDRNAVPTPPRHRD